MSFNLYTLQNLQKKQEISNKINQEYTELISQYIDQLWKYETLGKYEIILNYLRAYISDIELYSRKYNISYQEYLDNLNILCLSILNRNQDNFKINSVKAADPNRAPVIEEGNEIQRTSKSFKINYSLLYSVKSDPMYLQLIYDTLHIPKINTVNIKP